MSELNINNSFDNHLNWIKRNKQEYYTQTTDFAESIVNNETIDVAELHQLDQQLEKKWTEDGFNRNDADFSCSAVDGDGRLIKIIALGQKQQNVDYTTPSTRARIFIGGDQKDIEIPSLYRTDALHLADGSIRDNSLYEARDRDINTMIEVLEERLSRATSQDVSHQITAYLEQSSINDDLQWLIDQFGIQVATEDGSNILRTTKHDGKTLAVTGVGFETLAAAQQKVLENKMRAKAEDEAWEMHDQATQSSNSIKKKLFESARSLEARQLTTYRESMNNQSHKD